ncbi:DUF4956 domain-containing protein [Clostridia bacterium]|nr:DUF4956 domain-containing protein [Clostridia bacterium]
MQANSINIFASVLSGGLTIGAVALCTLCAVIAGLTLAAVYRKGVDASASYLTTLAILPLIVMIVITTVNGNLGAGVAVAGAFGLVRFRSMPGSAREISGVFCAMAIGLVLGMGYIGYAVLFLILIALFLTILAAMKFGEKSGNLRLLRMTIPETLDYEGVFDDVFSQFTTSNELVKVKTTNMGSLFDLTYRVALKEPSSTKAIIDMLRTRNGNLNISISRELSPVDEL